MRPRDEGPLRRDTGARAVSEAVTAAAGCLGCDLTAGRTPLPGGEVHRKKGWVVEHCIGPLGAGTLIVKPLRHVTRLADLLPEEALALGPLLREVSAAVTRELEADQTYICQWSHAGWTPGHLHFVVQPAWNSQREHYERPGPFLQTQMFEEAAPLDTQEVAAVCERLRARLSGASRA